MLLIRFHLILLPTEEVGIIFGLGQRDINLQ